MKPLKAHVQDGRLVLGEPTDLPEGEVACDVEKDFDDQERAALYQALDEGIDAARAGDHIDAEQFVQSLLDRT